MWPFSCLFRINPEENNETQDFNHQFIQELTEWRKLGESFEYLGRIMVVTAHYKTDIIIVSRFPEIRMKPSIHANYADDLGVIHSITFNVQESLALMNNATKC